MLRERNSLRSIACATGVARNTIAQRVKKSGGFGPATAPFAPEKGPTETMGGLGVGQVVDVRGPQKMYGLALAGGRNSRRVVAWVLGSRGTATLQRLWRALPQRYCRHTRYFTDAWWAYPRVLPAAAHTVGKTGTRVVEALNGKLRHRCSVLVRRSRACSQVSNKLLQPHQNCYRPA